MHRTSCIRILASAARSNEPVCMWGVDCDNVHMHGIYNVLIWQTDSIILYQPVFDDNQHRNPELNLRLLQSKFHAPRG